MQLAYPGAKYSDFTSSPKYASLIVHLETGRVIHASNAKMLRNPASLAKVMTLYILFDEINKGKLHFAKEMRVSKNAASKPKSHLQLKAGSSIKVREAILALIVKSANDVATVVAEEISGSEAKFAGRMTAKARELGMLDTVFCNASGLPNPNQLTTAYDMAILSMAMQKNHAEYYHFFSKRSFKFKNQVIKGHNHVLKKYRWATGLKTGYINSSGFNIITTSNKPEGRLIAVVMGGSTVASRDAHTIALLESAYKSVASKKTRSYHVKDKQIKSAIEQPKNLHSESASPFHLLK